MKGKVSSQKKRYREGMRTCIILMVILLIITVTFQFLSDFIGRQDIDTSRFEHADRTREFSVPMFECPVEIDIDVVGGGNATFYLVKGALKSIDSREIRYNEEYASYIDNNTITKKTNTRSFEFDGKLEPGDYTIFIFRLLERRSPSDPIIIGIDAEGSSEEVYTDGKVFYNKVHVYVLKPIMPFIYVLFVIVELILVLWFFSFIYRKKHASDEEPEPRPLIKMVKVAKKPRRDTSPSWEAALRAGGPRRAPPVDNALPSYEVPLLEAAYIEMEGPKPRMAPGEVPLPPASSAEKATRTMGRKKKGSSIKKRSKASRKYISKSGKRKGKRSGKRKGKRSGKKISKEDGTQKETETSRHLSEILEELKTIVPVVNLQNMVGDDLGKIDLKFQDDRSMDETIIETTIKKEIVYGSSEESTYHETDEVSLEEVSSIDQLLGNVSVRAEDFAHRETHHSGELDEEETIPVLSPMSPDDDDGLDLSEKDGVSEDRTSPDPAMFEPSVADGREDKRPGKDKISRERRDRLENVFSNIIQKKEDGPGAGEESDNLDSFRFRMDRLMDMILK